jgi:hypothetical protein
MAVIMKAISKITLLMAMANFLIGQDLSTKASGKIIFLMEEDRLSTLTIVDIMENLSIAKGTAGVY